VKVCYNYYSFCYMMMNEQLLMFKRKSNHIGHKSLLCCASKPNTKNVKMIIFQLKDADNVNRKQNLSMQTYPPWIIFNHDIFIAFFFRLHLLDSDVQSKTPHATLKGFTYINLLVQIASTKLSSFSICANALCGMNSSPQNANDVQQCVKG